MSADAFDALMEELGHVEPPQGDPPPRDIEAEAAKQDAKAEAWITKAWGHHSLHDKGSTGAKQWEYLIQRHKVGWALADDKLRGRTEEGEYTTQWKAELAQMESDWPENVLVARPSEIEARPKSRAEQLSSLGTDPATLRATAGGELVEGAQLAEQLGDPEAGSGGVPSDIWMEGQPLGKARADVERARKQAIAARRKTLFEFDPETGRPVVEPATMAPHQLRKQMSFWSTELGDMAQYRKLRRPELADVVAAGKAEEDYQAALAVLADMEGTSTPSSAVFGERQIPVIDTKLLREPLWEREARLKQQGSNRIAAHRLARTRTRQSEAGKADVPHEKLPSWVHKYLPDIPLVDIPDWGGGVFGGLKAEQKRLQFQRWLERPYVGREVRVPVSGGIHFAPTKPVGAGSIEAQLLRNTEAIQERKDGIAALTGLGRDDKESAGLLEELRAEIAVLQRIRDRTIPKQEGVRSPHPEMPGLNLPEASEVKAPYVETIEGKPGVGGRRSERRE